MTSRNARSNPTDGAAIDALDALSGKWQPIVLLTLLEQGPLGFNELLNATPDVSGKVLSDTLDDLEETGIVDRTVLDESPLRVEYECTDAGRDLEAIFEDLATWSERHLRATPPTVLLADGDPRITQMFEGWLSDRYDVVRAHDADAVRDHLLDPPDVLLIERSLPGANGASLVESARSSCRVVLLLGKRPGLDLLDVACDDVLRKPVVRNSAIEAIETQLDRAGQPEAKRLEAALIEKCSMLESTHSRESLAETIEYSDATPQLESLEEHLES